MPNTDTKDAARLRQSAAQTADKVKRLAEQLLALEQSETPDDLTAAVQHHDAIATAQKIVTEQRERLGELERAAAEAEALEQRSLALVALQKRAAKASERFNDSIMALLGARSELVAINDQSIGMGNGAMFAAVGTVKVPGRVVPSGDRYVVVSGTES